MTLHPFCSILQIEAIAVAYSYYKPSIQTKLPVSKATPWQDVGVLREGCSLLYPSRLYLLLSTHCDSDSTSGIRYNPFYRT